MKCTDKMKMQSLCLMTQWACLFASCLGVCNIRNHCLLQVRGTLPYLLQVLCLCRHANLLSQHTWKGHWSPGGTYLALCRMLVWWSHLSQIWHWHLGAPATCRHSIFLEQNSISLEWAATHALVHQGTRCVPGATPFMMILSWGTMRHRSSIPKKLCQVVVSGSWFVHPEQRHDQYSKLLRLLPSTDHWPCSEPPPRWRTPCHQGGRTALDDKQRWPKVIGLVCSAGLRSLLLPSLPYIEFHLHIWLGQRTKSSTHFRSFLSSCQLPLLVSSEHQLTLPLPNTANQMQQKESRTRKVLVAKSRLPR